MITPHNKIEDAINEAEAVASTMLPPHAPVTISNKTLLVLIEAAKHDIEYRSEPPFDD